VQAGNQMLHVVALVCGNSFQAGGRRYFESIQSNKRTISQSNGGNAICQNKVGGIALWHSQSGSLSTDLSSLRKEKFQYILFFFQGE
jgi:hypothetical protein